jgi:hypothetical protein
MTVMRTTLRYLVPVVVATAAAAIAVAPSAAADDTNPDQNIPECTDVAGDVVTGGTTTECETPGNVQLDASPSIDEPTYPYPWADEFYGPALIIGGWGPHGEEGGGGGHR